MIYKSNIPFIGSSINDSFTQSLLKTIRIFPNDRIAFIDPETGYKLKYHDIPDQINRFKSFLSENKIQNGSVIATLCGNSIEYIIFCLAALDLGAIVLPINPASKKYEIEKYLKTTLATHILTENSYVEKMKELEDSYANLHIILLESQKKHKTREFERKAVDPNSTAFIFFSSGTSGPPKAITHSHKGVAAHMDQALSLQTHNHLLSSPFCQQGVKDVIFGVLPLFHAGGLLTLVLFLSGGSTILMNKRWNEKTFADTVEKYKVTCLNIVPPLLDFMIPACPPEKLKTLRTLYIGAARSDPEKLSLLQAKIPHCSITQLFGMTEAGILLFMVPKGIRNWNTVGKPFAGVELKVLNEDQEELPPGKTNVGELWIRTPCIMSGYLNGGRLERRDWFNTGDLGWVDDDGFVYITGRVKEMIKVRGWQVNPYEIEDAIMAHFQEVKECAIAGVNSEKDGQLPKAFIVGKVDKEDVMQFVKDRFVSYKQLVDVEFLDELPKTASGKLMRNSLVAKK